MAAPSAAVATLAEHRGQVDDQDENCLTTRYGLGKQPGSGFERSTAAAERVGSMNDGSSVHSCVPPSLAWPAWQLYWQRQTRSSLSISASCSEALPGCAAAEGRLYDRQRPSASCTATGSR
jgi:hypothetical protein